jgi:hypothetical protein
MSSILRLLVGLGLCTIVLAVGGRVIAPCMLREMGMDWWNLKEQMRQHLEEQERADSLSQRDVVLLKRIDAKTSVVKKVIDGQLSLREAAASFRKLNSCPNGDVDDYRVLFPGTSEEECLCRQVIAWVSCELRSRHADKAMIGRLEAELADHLKHGTMNLPEGKTI